LNKKIKALFLCSKLAGYFYASIKYFSEEFGVECIVVSLPSSDNAPFLHNKAESITIVSAKTPKLYQFIVREYENSKPNIVYVSGWNYKIYRKIGRYFKRENVKVLMGMDNHYTGDLKQFVFKIGGRKWIKSFASLIWVAGANQYEYAVKLGFRTNEIVTGLYSADDSVFNQVENIEKREKIILFVGRLVEFKQANVLVDVFREVNSQLKEKWKLLIVGNGPQKREIQQDEFVRVLNFLQPGDLVNLTKKASVFCLPSTRENWGVVVHEYALLGMVLLLSKNVGASKEFLIDGLNGRRFDPFNREDFRQKMHSILSKNLEEIYKMGIQSKGLSSNITKKRWAYKLMSQTRKEE